MTDEMPNQQAVSLDVSSPHLRFRGIAPWWLKARALAVHFYTASGAVLAFLIVLAAIHGNAVQALWLALAALVIDGTDGWLARRFRVSEMLPWFDGRRLDDIVDYLTYVFAPILLLWNTGHLVGMGGMILAVAPLLASGYQFCRVDAKTDDHFFLGFPSYWNVIAFYAIVANFSLLTVGIILVVCSVLVFVPIRYLYPSRTVAFRPITLALTGLWLAAYILILVEMPNPSPVLIYCSFLYFVYYVGISLYFTFRAMRPAVATS
jgi:phosphatidylcholine synthase